MTKSAQGRPIGDSDFVIWVLPSGRLCTMDHQVMPTYTIPKSAGKFTVVVAQGGHFAVWNRKHGKASVSIPVRKLDDARKLCEKLNRGEHEGRIGTRK